MLLPFRIHQGHSLLQAFAAIACHLLQVRQESKLFCPGLAAHFLGKLTAYPAQALRFHDHQHRIFDINFIPRRLTHQRPRQFIQNRQQFMGFLSGCPGASAQARHAQNLAGNQDLQQFPAIPQRHSTRLADAGQFRLFLLVNHHCLRQALLQLRLPLLQLPHFCPQPFRFLLLGQKIF